MGLDNKLIETGVTGKKQNQITSSLNSLYKDSRLKFNLLKQ